MHSHQRLTVRIWHGDAPKQPYARKRGATIIEACLMAWKGPGEPLRGARRQVVARELEVTVLHMERKDGESAKRTVVNRRSAIIAASAAVIAAGMSARTGAARQETDLPEVVVAFLAAWVALDAEGITQTYADGGVREDITAPDIIRGREDIRRSLFDFIGAFDNAKVEHPVAFAAADGFAADTWVFTGEYTGSLPGLPPGNGKPVTIQGFTLIEIAAGSIIRTIDYYDACGLLVQVGGLAQSPATATPVD